MSPISLVKQLDQLKMNSKPCKMPEIVRRESEFTHVDDFILQSAMAIGPDKANMQFASFVLMQMRLPAAMQTVYRKLFPLPPLYCTHNGKRVRVTMASRMGDVGVNTLLEADRGYSARVCVDELSEFSDSIEYRVQSETPGVFQYKHST